MHRLIILGTVAISLLASGAAQADANALGLYFSDSEFTYETANAMVTQGAALVAYIVLTEATGTIVAGYEVAISSTAPDFTIILTSLFWGENSGTNENQIVTFASPVPVNPGGTVLATIIFTTESTDPETISFGPSEPSSLPDGVPVVDFGGGDLHPCSYPFGTPVVARLNDVPVPTAASSWSGVKALFE
ncbi:MAG TPA: hypothetical protein PLL30_00390 [Candidatus Krumholzibacteria bacterium]|nr:hypothetical protein [Candidatus Krumholzibacteria bacterium]HPD70217.1 hypothetical protein [Candidatus Krumholzibacteria bacterium]HRY40083.1 hypothetical protein [Candidatus Krumholzibacteria bacterium]